MAGRKSYHYTFLNYLKYSILSDLFALSYLFEADDGNLNDLVLVPDFVAAVEISKEFFVLVAVVGKVCVLPGPDLF